MESPKIYKLQSFWAYSAQMESPPPVREVKVKQEWEINNSNNNKKKLKNKGSAQSNDMKFQQERGRQPRAQLSKPKSKSKKKKLPHLSQVVAASFNILASCQQEETLDPRDYIDVD